jgi:hypothetical protein
MLDSQPPKDRSLQLISLDAPNYKFKEPVKLSALRIWIGPVRFSASSLANLNSVYVIFSNHAITL